MNLLASIIHLVRADISRGMTQENSSKEALQMKRGINKELCLG